MKIVFDTNVILSALITQGLSSRVFGICHARYRLFISQWIISEVIDKLKSKFKVSPDQVKRIQNFLVTAFTVINPEGDPPSLCRDKDDNNVLHLAGFIKSDLIITGDNGLLVLKQYEECKIINPRTFLEEYYQS